MEDHTQPDGARPDLYDVAMVLYGSVSGSSDSAYAYWSDYPRTQEEDVAYLRQRLADWREPSSEIDNAFRAWIVAILAYVEPTP